MTSQSQGVFTVRSFPWARRARFQVLSIPSGAPRFPTSKTEVCPGFPPVPLTFVPLIECVVPPYTELDAVQPVSPGLQIFTQQMFCPEGHVCLWSWLLRFPRKGRGREPLSTALAPPPPHQSRKRKPLCVHKPAGSCWPLPEHCAFSNTGSC